MPHSDPEPTLPSRAAAWFKTALAMLVAALASGTIAALIAHDDAQDARQRVAELASIHAHSVSERIDRSLSANYALAVLLRHGDGEMADFGPVAEEMMRVYGGISALALAPRGVIRQIFPLAGNEPALGRDLFDPQTHETEAVQARDTGRLTLAGPFRLVQGGDAIVGRLPVTLPDAAGRERFWGLTSTVIRVEDLIASSSLPRLEEEGYSYHLTRENPATGTAQSIARSASELNELAVPVEIQVPNGTWTLRVAPARGWGSPELVSALALFVLTATALAGVLAFSVTRQPQRLQQQVAERTAEVTRVNAELQAEIAERRRAEARMRRSEAQLQRAQAVARSGSWSVDLAEGQLHFSDEMRRILGLDLLAPVGPDSLRACVAPEDRGTFEDAWAEARTRKSRPLEFRIVVGGETKWVRGIGEPVHDAAGMVTGVVGTLQDITERKQAELMLGEERALLRALIDSIPDLIFVKDTAGAYLACNRAFEAFFGRSEREIVGGTDHDFVSRETADFFRSRDAIVMASGEARTNDEWVTYPNGRSVLLETMKTPFFGADGALRGLIGVSRDITERKRAEMEVVRLNESLEARVQARTAELEQALREVEAFSYSASHDLRTPLRGIEGFSTLLASEYGERLDEEGRQYVRRIRAAAQRMAQLIDDLLDLSRLSRADLNKRRVDLTELAVQIVADLRRSEPQRQVEVRIQPGLVEEADPAMIQVVLTNLLGNAWKFTARRSDALIEFGRETLNGRPTYHVRDNGAGFDMAFADTLFRPFKRLHSPHEFAGSGIGLATVRRIIDRHGGTIWAQGAVDQGAVFHFTLIA